MANPNSPYEKSGSDSPGGTSGSEPFETGLESFESAEEALRREKIEAGVEELRASVADAQEALKSLAGEVVDSGMETAASLTDSLKVSIGRQPITAVILAGLVGYVLGSLNAHRR